MLTIEQIKTLINGLRQPIMNAIKQSQEAKSTSEQAQSVLSEKMDILNPVGVGSFSMGRQKGTTIGENSFAVGFFTEASGYGSHAEGSGSEATGTYSHSEGNLSRASGHSSHAEGQGCHAEGNCSHAEGSDTQALSYASHAEGFRTIAEGFASHVEGRSNIPSNEYLHIVGNGDNSGDRRSNAHTLDWKGNAWYQGDVLVGSTSGTNRDEGSVRLAKITEVISAPVTAEVGQTVVVSAVNENGAPTAWEAVNMPKWRYLGKFTTEEDVQSFVITTDSYGNPLSLNRVRVHGKVMPSETYDSITGVSIIRVSVQNRIMGQAWVAEAMKLGGNSTGSGFMYSLSRYGNKILREMGLGPVNTTSVPNLLSYTGMGGPVLELGGEVNTDGPITVFGIGGYSAGVIGAGSWFEAWGVDE